MFLQKNLQVKRRRRAEKPENVQEVIKNSQNYFFSLRTEVSLMYGF